MKSSSIGHCWDTAFREAVESGDTPKALSDIFSRRDSSNDKDRGDLKIAGLEWTKDVNEEIFGDQFYSPSYATGEVKELWDEVKKMNLPGVRKELSDVLYAGNMVAHGKTGLNFPMIGGQFALNKFRKRNKVWKDLMESQGVEFHVDHLSGGSNFHKPAKVRAAFASAGKDLTPEEANNLSLEAIEMEKTASLSDEKVLEIHRAQEVTNRKPSKKQREAGNFRKGRVKLRGRDIAIENPIGSVREGTSGDGKKWRTVMAKSYGYFVGTEAVDGDPVDVFIGSDPEEGKIWVVDQIDKDGNYDEPKVILGEPDKESAEAAYLDNFEPGWTGLGGIKQMSEEEFLEWLDNKPSGAVTSDKMKASSIAVSWDAAFNKLANMQDVYLARTKALSRNPSKVGGGASSTSPEDNSKTVSVGGGASSTSPADNSKTVSVGGGNTNYGISQNELIKMQERGRTIRKNVSQGVDTRSWWDRGGGLSGRVSRIAKNPATYGNLSALTGIGALAQGGFAGIGWGTKKLAELTARARYGEKGVEALRIPEEYRKSQRKASPFNTLMGFVGGSTGQNAASDLSQAGRFFGDAPSKNIHGDYVNPYKALKNPVRDTRPPSWYQDPGHEKKQSVGHYKISELVPGLFSLREQWDQPTKYQKFFQSGKKPGHTSQATNLLAPLLTWKDQQMALLGAARVMGQNKIQGKSMTPGEGQKMLKALYQDWETPNWFRKISPDATDGIAEIADRVAGNLVNSARYLIGKDALGEANKKSE